MMKPRVSTSRIMGEQTITSRKSEALSSSANNGGGGSQSQRSQGGSGSGGQLNAEQSKAQARKRRSSINVYDQPSSINLRLRQLETDMIRLDEDRTKLFDDTHSALTQYELRLTEIHAILKSRQDNVEKYVEDMRLLLQAKEDFERQAKLLNEKHERIHEKFMHRETTISREIKLLKNKFELLERNRQFRSILQKSNANHSDINDDLISGLDPNDHSRQRSEVTSQASGSTLQATAGGQQVGSDGVGVGPSHLTSRGKRPKAKASRFGVLKNLVTPLLVFAGKKPKRSDWQKSNKVSALETGGIDGSDIAQTTTNAISQVVTPTGETTRINAEAIGVVANDLAPPADAVASSNTVAAKSIKKGGILLGRFFR